MRILMMVGLWTALFFLSSCATHRVGLQEGSISYVTSSTLPQSKDWKTEQAERTSITKEELLKILKLKERCKRWPNRAKQLVQDAERKMSLRYERKLKTKQNALDACVEKQRTCFRTKCNLLAPILISGGVGVVVGVLGTVIIVVSLQKK